MAISIETLAAVAAVSRRQTVASVDDIDEKKKKTEIIAAVSPKMSALLGMELRGTQTAMVDDVDIFQEILCRE